MTTLLSPADLAELRGVAESAMDDACRIVRRSTDPVDQGDLDPVTLQYPTVDLDDEPVVYLGVCEVDHQPATAETPVADADTAETYVVVKIPVTATGAADVRRGDVVRITTAVHTPALQDRVVTVVGFDDKTYSTKRRLTCREGV